jgi:hypothetical protein
VRRYVLGAVVLYTVMWAGLTYPQVRQLDTGVNDVGDPLLNTWALAWVAHQLPFAPAHVFDANIFHPERRTLAYSETLLAPATAAAPLLWLGAGPVLVYNLLLMTAFVASGVGTALLVRDLTGSGAAALVSGGMFAFLPIKFDHYAHFQLLLTQWMPLSLWAFHRFVATGRHRWAVVLGAMVGAQALTSIYNTLFLAVMLGAVGAVVLGAEWRRLPHRLPGLALAVLVSAVLAAPAAIAHLRASEIVGERSRADVENGSADWWDFLSASPGNRTYGGWTSGWGQTERRLFPGLLVLALAALALWPPWSVPRLAYAAALIVMVDVARGFNGWIYPVLYDHVFVFRSLRVPARMAMTAGLPLAVLAGFGLTRLLSYVPSRRHALVAGLLIGVVMVESWTGPLALASVPRVPPEIYADLMADKGEPPRTTIIRRHSDRAPVVILELPINQDDPTFMYYSTFHWQTLVNGYSGFYSARYVMLHDTLTRFPNHQALEELARLQTRYVLVHGEMIPPARYRELTTELENLPSFRLVSKRPWKGAEIALYGFEFQPAR